MAILTRDAILGMTRKTASVKTADGEFRLMEMTLAERDAFEMSISQQSGIGLDNFRARMIAATAVDADGQRLFGPDDVAALAALPSSLAPVGDAAIRLCGFSTQDVDDLVKN